MGTMIEDNVALKENLVLALKVEDIKSGDVDMQYPDFSARELIPDCECEVIWVDLRVMNRIQLLRSNVVRGPIYINSGYRTWEYNRQIGGAKRSQHLHGRALDVRTNDMPHEELCWQAKAVGFKGIIKYSEYVHLDVRETEPYYYGFGKYDAAAFYNEEQMDV